MRKGDREEMMVSSSADGTIGLWIVQRNAPVNSIRAHDSVISCASATVCVCFYFYFFWCDFVLLMFKLCLEYYDLDFILSLAFCFL